MQTPTIKQALWVAVLMFVGCGDDPTQLECPAGKTCGFTEIAGGYEHTCALYSVITGADDDYGQVVCWGENRDGRCGEASGFGQSQALHPLVVADLMDAQSIAAGGTQSCAIRSTGAVVCWGGNGFAELGFLREEGSFVPVARSFPPIAANRVQLAAGGSSLGGTTCARDADNDLWCWGRNHENQVRTGDSEAQEVPIQIQGISDTRDVSVGQDHACTINDNNLLCWGSTFGTAPSRVDIDVADFDSGTWLTSKGFRTCVRGDNDVKCFTGFYRHPCSDCQGGFNIVADVISTPLADTQQVATGALHTCALRDDGDVVCWGDGSSGRLGIGEGSASDPTNEINMLPAALRDASGNALNITQISGGASHSCALDAEHDIYCWGDNSHGQLGNGTEASSSTPKLVQIAL